jgi:AcrR family transcriptional regulator
MTPIIVDKDEKKRMILKAAMNIFVEKGYNNVNMSDVAQVAGMSKGNIYGYFKSREVLFMEIFNFIIDEHLNYFHKRSKGGTTAKEKLGNLISFYIHAYLKREKFIYILIDYIAHNRGAEGKSFYKKRLSQVYKLYRKKISSLIEEGIQEDSFRRVDTDHMASIILTLIDGLMFQLFFTYKSFSFKKIDASINDMVFAYLSEKKQI